MPPKANSVDVGFVEKNQSSMTMVMKVPEPGEPAIWQNIKLFWLQTGRKTIKIMKEDTYNGNVLRY